MYSTYIRVASVRSYNRKVPKALILYGKVHKVVVINAKLKGYPPETELT